ncbi:MAG: autotransporter-associated beta strand repeat-containing protein [Candidatus Methylacidiphilales bacterium]|nr:autotransporter-associated beta strand repeat-containing protein [Candidatus Methylacidiphilales bacterium]
MISAGTLALGSNLAIRNSAIDTSGSGNITLAAGVTTPTFGGLSGSKNLSSVITGNYSLVTGLTLNTVAGSTKTYSGNITNGATGMTLTKTGNGTQILSGNNTYTGATAVNGGTLLINGSLSGTSGVTVATGATLGGSGTINALVTVGSGGNLSPGNSPGLASYAAGLTQSTGSSFTWELNTNDNSLGIRGISFDGVDVSGGTLTIQSGATSALVFNGSGSSVLWSDTFWDSSRQWLVYDNANAPTLASSGIFDTITLTLDSGSNSLASIRAGSSFSWSQSGNDIYLNYTAVPEPSTYAMVLGGLAALLCLRRRAKKLDS